MDCLTRIGPLSHGSDYTTAIRHCKDGAQVDVAGITELLTGRGAKDELGQLAEAYLAMVRRIETNIQEIEALHTIGQEINTIGSEDLEGMLRRITDRAVKLVQTDICLVLLCDKRTGCWTVEAASGEWNDRLKKSLMPWGELPVCVQAFETGTVAIGEQFCSTRVADRAANLIGDSTLAIPLSAQGIPFGVLSFLNEQPRSEHEWNQRLAEGISPGSCAGHLKRAAT